MVRSEVAKLLAVLAAAYPRFEVNELTERIWFEMLQDIPYQVAQVAIKKLILESPYPPAIADVRKQAMEIITPPEEKLDAAQAWGEVERAIRFYGYYREAEALASMSPRTAKVTKWMGWQEICMSEEPSVIRGQFLKMYQQIQTRDKEETLLPESLKNGIARVAARHDSKTIEGGKKS
jgi:hypothetical protein